MRLFCKSTYSASHFLPAMCLVFLLAATTSAYTIVMRSGRRLEIPAQFALTKTTLTYEAGPGLLVTLQIAAIDITATEQVNNEAPGSLLSRAGPKTGGLSELEEGDRAVGPARLGSHGQQDGISPAKARTITNRDLESYARARRENESAYEKRRIKLGLPSAEESRRKASAEFEAVTREIEQRRSQENESEAYWRSRASELRAEIAAVDAEIDYIRGGLEDVPFPTWAGSYTVTSVWPFTSFGRFGVGPTLGGGVGMHGFRRPDVFIAPRRPQMNGHIGFGSGGTRGRVLLNPGIHARGRGFGIALSLPLETVTASGSPYDFVDERSALITRFNELAGIKAGLNARWRELEDEARRAGVPPGWLRP